MIDLCSKGFMSIKNDHKQPPAVVLSSVVAEMARPRVVESAKRVGERLADGEDPINHPQKKRLFRVAAALGCFRARN
jgi:hypothetical protein